MGDVVKGQKNIVGTVNNNGYGRKTNASTA